MRGQRAYGRRGLVLGATMAVASWASSSPAPAADTIASVHYACAGGKTIAATYHADHVAVVLSDGRALDLPQTIAASGIRYANADESLVFWSKGKTAFVTEGSSETYADCTQE